MVWVFSFPKHHGLALKELPILSGPLSNSVLVGFINLRQAGSVVGVRPQFSHELGGVKRTFKEIVVELLDSS